MKFDFPVDVEDFLTRLNVRNVRRRGPDVEFSCPFPAHSYGDRTPSAMMHVETTAFHCFSCGAKGNAVSFLAEMEGVSPVRALLMLEKEFGGGFREPQKSFRSELESHFAPKETVPVNPPIDETEVEKRAIDWGWTFSQDGWLEHGRTYGQTWSPFAYMFERNFAAATLDEWEIGVDEQSNRVAIPARDEHGRLIGFKGRAWWPQHEPKYLVLGGKSYGFKPYEVAHVLFGLHRAVLSDGELIVCEGELNAIAMHQNGYTNVVGISGRELSMKQARLIHEYADRVVFLFDVQHDAERAAERLIRSMPCFLALAHDKDPADMKVDELVTLVSGRAPYDVLGSTRLC